jgi:RNAse (barnase) inhibitor barstar
MAVFDLSNPEQFDQLDWKILQNGAVSLYLDPNILEADCTWFRDRNYREYRFDGTAWLTREDFYTAMDQQLTLPYSSGNLDTLRDLLMDLEVPHESGTIFVFWRFDLFTRRFTKDTYNILNVMEEISRGFLLTGQRFIVLVQSNDPKITFDPVGAHPVILNPTENIRHMRHTLKKVNGEKNV